MRLRISAALCALAFFAVPAAAAPQYAGDGYSIIRPEAGATRKPQQRSKLRAPARSSQPSPPAVADDETPPRRRRATVYPYQPPPQVNPREGIVTPRTSGSVDQTFRDPPPPVVVPGSSRSIPNLPSPGGRAETTQDRSLRCAHQAGLNGVPGDQRGGYITSCIGQ